MSRPTYYTAAVDVDIYIDDILEEFSDEDIEELYRERFGEEHDNPALSQNPDNYSLSEFADIVDTLVRYHGADWVNRWLKDYQLELREKSK